MTLRIARVALALALAVLSLLALRPAAQAQGPDLPTFLTFQPLDPAPADSRVSISVRLTTGRGDPIKSKPVTIALTSEITTRTNTDDDGISSLSAKLAMAPGTYTIIASFDGALGLQPARATASLVVTGEATETVLAVRPIGPIAVETNVQLQAQLATVQGAPIEGVRLVASVDGVYASEGTTDANGYAFIGVGKGIALGTHRVVVSFDGTKEYAPSNQQLVLDVRPLEVELHTSPALEGVRVRLLNQVYTTGKDGIVRIPVDSPGTYNVEVLPYQAANSDVRAEFQGWDDGSTTPFNEVKVPSSGPIDIGFNLSYQVRPTFVDLQGRPVDPKRISSISFKRNDGVVYEFANEDPRWLDANYLLRRSNGLDPSDFQYALLSVIVNGTNVVSAQQQRFYVRPNDVWTIQLLLFGAGLQAHDLMFGFPLGSSVRLEYPDHSQGDIPLDKNGEGHVYSLPRGAYKVSVNTHLGIAPVSSLTMSRDQVVDLKVISYLDILTVLLVGLALGPGLLLIGQPRLRQSIWSGAFLKYLRHPFRRRATSE